MILDWFEQHNFIQRLNLSRSAPFHPSNHAPSPLSSFGSRVSLLSPPPLNYYSSFQPHLFFFSSVVLHELRCVWVSMSIARHKHTWMCVQDPCPPPPAQSFCHSESHNAAYAGQMLWPSLLTGQCNNGSHSSHCQEEEKLKLGCEHQHWEEHTETPPSSTEGGQHWAPKTLLGALKPAANITLNTIWKPFFPIQTSQFNNL